MSDERLWAPWRLNYIAGGSVEPPPEPTAWRDGAERSCFLCRAAATFADEASTNRQLLVVDRGPHTVTVLNRYPYNNGHLLVSPLRHVAEFTDLSTDEQLESMAELARFTQVYRRVIRAEGFNIGLNLGAVAGAGVPGHLHWHLVPRWAGDHNFMPATAATRVISQSLDALWDAVTAELEQHSK